MGSLVTESLTSAVTLKDVRPNMSPDITIWASSLNPDETAAISSRAARILFITIHHKSGKIRNAASVPDPAATKVGKNFCYS